MKLSVALPSSIVDNCPTLELKSLLAGTIGRTMAIFKVDEVIIYNDNLSIDDSDYTKLTHSVLNLYASEMMRHRTTPTKPIDEDAAAIPVESTKYGTKPKKLSKRWNHQNQKLILKRKPRSMPSMQCPFFPSSIIVICHSCSYQGQLVNC